VNVCKILIIFALKIEKEAGITEAKNLEEQAIFLQGNSIKKWMQIL
jgi:hypothetical protein